MNIKTEFFTKQLECNLKDDTQIQKKVNVNQILDLLNEKDEINIQFWNTIFDKNIDLIVIELNQYFHLDLEIKLKELIPFYNYTIEKYSKTMINIGITICLITNILYDKQIAILLLKGGKSIQISNVNQSNDYDLIILPYKELDSEILDLDNIKIQQIALQIGYLIKKIFNSDKDYLQLSIEKKITNNESDIIKISMQCLDLGYIALIDIGCGFNYTNEYIKELYQSKILETVQIDILEAQFSISGKFLYVSLDKILLEKIFYLIKYSLKDTLQENKHFLSKLPNQIIHIFRLGYTKEQFFGLVDDVISKNTIDKSRIIINENILGILFHLSDHMSCLSGLRPSASDIKEEYINLVKDILLYFEQDSSKYLEISNIRTIIKNEIGTYTGNKGINIRWIIKQIPKYLELTPNIMNIPNNIIEWFLIQESNIDTIDIFDKNPEQRNINIKILNDCVAFIKIELPT